MNQFQALYAGKPTPEDIQATKIFLSQSEASSAWEDYYWGAKVLCAFDTENFDAKFVIKVLNTAIQLGLSFRASKDQYLDAIKILATLNAQNGNYEIVLNYLGSVLELDENAPDWVYHDFVSAQIHTDAIQRILRRPRLFLEDLSRNDGKNAGTKERQTAIFKEFLAVAVQYICGYPKCEVDRSALKRAASTYGLLESNGWTVFEKACAGKYAEQSPISGNAPDQAQMSKPSAAKNQGGQPASKSERPFVISLFPEDDVPKSVNYSVLEKEHAELLAELDKARTALEENRQALEKQDADLDKLRSERENLIASAKEGSADQQRLQEEITKAAAENETLRAKIKDLENIQSTKLEAVRNDTPADIISHIHIYLHTVQIKLVAWLEHNLPQCEDNWWDCCVISTLSYEQRERAHELHYTSLNQLDLAALLRVMNKNWFDFRKLMYLSDADRDSLQKMFEVRNRWAHMDSNLPDKETVKGDLYAIADFMMLLRCSKEATREVNDYAKVVGKMAL